MSIQLRFTDGSVVAGEKDCTCLDTIHTGPHWVYMDDLWRKSNERLRAAGNVRGFIVADLARVREKGFQMTRHDIVEIIREGMA